MLSLREKALPSMGIDICIPVYGLRLWNEISTEKLTLAFPRFLFLLSLGIKDPFLIILHSFLYSEVFLVALLKRFEGFCSMLVYVVACKLFGHWAFV